MTTNQREFYLGLERAAAAARAQTGAARARLVHATLAGDEPAGAACRDGCAHCCRFPVGVRLAEALQLAAAIADDDALRARVLAAATRTAAKPWAELAGEACPLLDDGRCARYEARPTPCRALRSFDADRCERALTGPVEVPRDESGWWRGLGAAALLDDEHGPRELRSALAALLALPAGATPADARQRFAAARSVSADDD